MVRKPGRVMFAGVIRGILSNVMVAGAAASLLGCSVYDSSLLLPEIRRWGARERRWGARERPGARAARAPVLT